PVGYVSLGAQKVKNIAEKVRVYRLKLNGPPQQRIGQRYIAGGWRWAIAATGILLIVVASTAAWHIYSGPPPEGGKPSIAVLPFDNLGADDATGRLADGITEDIIADLARFRELDVIARNSTFTYKGKPVDIRQAGKDLNVRYILEGSI